ncbi:hypothetical protein GCM10023333_22800 [Ferrimonas pelagia]|uniref:TM2 domain-containing protein n=1 Tax=Ferrimonas pelagia TaxID=1177826 RepID=A0ABP9EYV4_9GAMM
MVCPECGAGLALDALAGIDPALTLRSQRAASRFGLWLGTFGIHRFYLGQPVRGSLYLAFCWTLVPTVLGIVDGIRMANMSRQQFYRRCCLA